MVLSIAIVAIVVIGIVLVLWRWKQGTSGIESRVEFEGPECPTCGELFDDPEELREHIAHDHGPTAQRG